MENKANWAGPAIAGHGPPYRMVGEAPGARNGKQTQFGAEGNAPQSHREHRDECKCFFEKELGPMLCALCDSVVRNWAGEMLVLSSEPKNVKQSQFQDRQARGAARLGIRGARAKRPAEQQEAHHPLLAGREGRRQAEPEICRRRRGPDRPARSGRPPDHTWHRQDAADRGGDFGMPFPNGGLPGGNRPPAAPPVPRTRTTETTDTPGASLRSFVNRCLPASIISA